MSSSEFTLEKVLEYRNADVVDNFCATFALPRDEAEVLFQDVLRWLWLSNKAHESHTAMFVDPTMQLFDEMWHTFILFTRDYQEFCDRYFGFYVHHKPTPQDEYAQQISSYETDPQQYMARLQDQFKAQYGLIYDMLGAETLVKW